MILLDGSCGGRLWGLAEQRGIKRDQPWKYNIDNPELVLDMHKLYIDAGCSMIQTNTFSANRGSVGRCKGYDIESVISAAVHLAKKAVENTDVGVYLSVGPLTVLLEPYGGLTEEECAEIYKEIIEIGNKEGVQAIMLETFMDVEMMKIAATEAKKTGLPVIASMTFEKSRRTMMGNTVSQICRELEKIGVDAVGMNCSVGPADGLTVIKEFYETTDLPLYFKPNSGMGENYDAVQFADEIEPALEYVKYIGGCCGTDETYIKELKRRIDASR